MLEAKYSIIIEMCVWNSDLEQDYVRAIHSEDVLSLLECAVNKIDHDCIKTLNVLTQYIKTSGECMEKTNIHKIISIKTMTGMIKNVGKSKSKDSVRLFNEQKIESTELLIV